MFQQTANITFSVGVAQGFASINQGESDVPMTHHETANPAFALCDIQFIQTLLNPVSLQISLRTETALICNAI
jgi:hypothetical protein